MTQRIAKSQPLLALLLFVGAVGSYFVGGYLGQLAVTLSGKVVVSGGKVVIIPRGTTYYVAASGGNDSLAGTTTGTAWATIGKVNAFIAAGNLHPGDSVLFQRGGVWRDDYIKFLNLTVTSSGTAIPAIYPLSGAPNQPITVGTYGTGNNPLIDGADPLSCTWTLLSGTTWQCSGVTTAPISIFVDSPTSNSLALTPVPNSLGTYSGITSYPYLSGATGSDGNYYVCGIVAGCTGHDPTVSGSYFYWAPVSNNLSGNSSYSFDPTKSGIQNVQSTGNHSWNVYTSGGSGYAGSSYAFTATCNGSADPMAGTMLVTGGVPNPGPLNITTQSTCPVQPVVTLTSPGSPSTAVSFIYGPDQGSWYWDGSTITLQLTDGSNPNSHTFEATHRDYGVLLESVNYISITNIDTGHQAKSGKLNMVYSSPQWGYRTGEYNQFIVTNEWNSGGLLVADHSLDQAGKEVKQNGGIVSLSYQGYSNPPLIRGLLILGGNHLGCDGYFGQRGGAFCTSVYVGGMDNEVATYAPYGRTFLQGGYYTNPNSACLFVTAASQGGSTGINQGGVGLNMEVTHCHTAIGWGGISGGRLHNFLAHDIYGQGIQLGGFSTGTLVDHGVIFNAGKNPSAVGYNGMDCNGMPSPASGPNYRNEIHHMTIYNVNSAGITSESPGCYGAYLHDNVIDQYANFYQPGNPSSGTQVNRASLGFTTTTYAAYLTTPITSGTFLGTLGVTGLTNEVVGRFWLGYDALPNGDQIFVATGGGAAVGDTTIATSTTSSNNYGVTAVIQGGTTVGYLTQTLSTSGSIPSFPTTPLTAALTAGTVTLSSGGNTQNFTTPGAALGATTVSITSATPNFGYSFTQVYFDGYTNMTSSHNFWVSSQAHPFNRGLTCSVFVSTIIGSSTDSCPSTSGFSATSSDSTSSALGLRNESIEDVSLAPGSPLIGVGTGGTDVGALPVGCFSPLANCNP